MALLIIQSLSQLLTSAMAAQKQPYEVHRQRSVAVFQQNYLQKQAAGCSWPIGYRLCIPDQQQLTHLGSPRKIFFSLLEKLV